MYDHENRRSQARTMARILIVEDSPESLELMGYLLEAAGHQVLASSTLAQALACLRHVALDLVVCDLNLRGASGLDLLRSLRSEHGLADIPVIAITAGAGHDLPQRALAVGFDDFMRKPIEPRRFAIEVEHVLERSLGQTRRRASLSGMRSASAGAQDPAG